MDKKELIEKIEKLREPRILVIGDFAIDEMIYGNTQRISREAPVLILEYSHTNIILGTAANAAHNISKLNDGKVSAVGLYGKDYHADILLGALKDAKISTKYMVEDATRHTNTKTRISGSCSQSVTQQMVRIDRQSTFDLSKEMEDKVLSTLEEAIKEHDGVLLSDYHLGFLTQNLVSKTVELCKKHNKIVVADVQKDFEKYKGVDAITPNQPDCEKYVGYFIKDEETLKKAGNEIVEKLGLKNLLLTRGSSGMALFENGKMEKIPAFNKKEVFDVTGAGDTVSAVYALGLCAGLSSKEAMIIGNLAASIVIRQFGCHTVTIEELKEELKGVNL